MVEQEKVVGDVFQELDEAVKTALLPDEEEPYSITRTFGPMLTILCC